MNHFQDSWIQEWCDNNGWTDLVKERYNHYWAFPPNAVMPEPIPHKVLRVIKSEKGFSSEEQSWLTIAIAISATSAILCYFLANPMPVVLAFAFDAITVAQLEVEEV
ncbi:conserved hypothetical protein [Hyella patelloides LEGE 07179]|uniref:Uncharacterized protein n=1 Tax=Hyella patelloides LEGE 07179 TaxID=945734 RepID=A0A563VQS7_9CYAN|nr:hypothetical protein [Hyella patelloides]VEP13818.1 conserved hypothetical protein [Hyella patelloides LEGE 07179]